MIIDLTRWPGPDPEHESDWDIKVNSNSAAAMFKAFARQYANFQAPAPRIIISSQLAAQLSAYMGVLSKQMTQFDKDINAVLNSFEEADPIHLDSIPKPPKNHGPRGKTAFSRGGKKRF
jgi:hypothetical protein